MTTLSLRGLLAAAALLLPALLPAPAAAKDTPVTEAELAAHIRVLASDAFLGRAPGGEGEARTIAYMVGEMARAGLAPVPDTATPWLQPVPLIERTALDSAAAFRRQGRTLTLDDNGVLLVSRNAVAGVQDAPLVFVGHGVDGAGAVRADVRGKVAVMLFADPPYPVTVPARLNDRRRLLGQSGAAAVLVVAGAGVPWSALTRAVTGPSMTLASQDTGGPALNGFLSQAAFDALVKADGKSTEALTTAAKADDFAGQALDVRADLSATTAVRAFDSHNVLARLPGANPDGRAVLLLGHWDHLGLCRPEDTPNRICNGAVDNASGIAVMLAVAKRLAATGQRPDRDVYFLGTTAEEKGLLGAYHFAANLPVAADSIIAALNVDTIAIAPRGAPVAIIGRGKAPYDAAVASVAAKLGRTMDDDGEADAFVRRQDGWALAQAGIPALMVGGSFSDMTLLQAFLNGPYHQPTDDLNQTIELGGAAEDADLHIALIRHFAGRATWP